MALLLLQWSVSEPPEAVECCSRSGVASAPRQPVVGRYSCKRRCRWCKQWNVLLEEEEDNWAELIVLGTGACLPLAGSRKFRVADKKIPFLQRV